MSLLDHNEFIHIDMCDIRTIKISYSYSYRIVVISTEAITRTNVYQVPQRHVAPLEFYESIKSNIL